MIRAFHRSLGATLLLLLVATVPAAGASELARFNAAVAEAFTHYRGALFYLRTENPAVAEFELQDAVALWSEKVMPFRDAAPDAFADDPDWAATLDQVSEGLSQGHELARESDIAAAEAALQPLQAAMADLRARNGVRVFSDCIDEANAAMDALWAYRHDPPDFADSAQVNDLRAKTAVTAYLYARCHKTAPPEISAAEEFQRIMEGSLLSLSRMWPAIDAGNSEAVINILRELRSFDRMLWLQFG